MPPISPVEVEDEVNMAKEKSTVRLGGDPEFFIANNGTKRIIASCGRIGGEKGNGLEISHGLKWLEDNVTVELNFPPIQYSDDFVSHMMAYAGIVSTKLATLGYIPVFQDAHVFPSGELVHHKAREFGCEPDFCAYNKDPEKTPRIVDARKFNNTRFCGGHGHLAYTNKDGIPAWSVAMILDAFVGLGAMASEKQPTRRATYGLAGLFRPKPYGIEYRTLSNFWLEQAFLIKASKDKDRLMRDYRISWLSQYARAMFSVAYAIENDPLGVSRLFNRLPVSDIQQAINKEDKLEAKRLITYLRSLYEARALDMFALEPMFNVDKAV